MINACLPEHCIKKSRHFKRDMQCQKGAFAQRHRCAHLMTTRFPPKELKLFTDLAGLLA
jgi:hypothetical protein